MNEWLTAVIPLAHTYLNNARQQEIAELEALSKTCELVRRAGELVHALQAERGAANAFLSSQGQIFRDSWQQKCAAADITADELIAQLHSPIDGSSRLYARIALAMNAFDSITTQRALVAKLAIPAAESAAQYTAIIGAHISLILEAVDTTVDPTVSRQLLALFNLIEAKEYAGRERANGIRMLAAVRAEASDQHLLALLIDQQEQSSARFESFCGDEIRLQWSALQATLPLRELERLRRQLLSPEPVLSPELIGTWFDTCSTRIDGLHQVERHLADLLEAACRKRIGETQAALVEQQHSADQSGAINSNWMDAATRTAGESPNHEQRLGSRLNRTLMDLLQQQSDDLRSISAELSEVRAALEDRKIIERAKGLLMAQQGVNEEAAYSLLRQKAMSQNARIGEIAATLLSMADFFPSAKL